MSNKIPKPLFFVVSFLIAFGLYWPSFRGTPIWDDWTYWFHQYEMKPEVPYLGIWLNFAWPLSVSFQKFLFSWWKENYFYYHLFSFCLHFANALMVYRLGRYLRVRYYYFYFLLFLLHPAAVISTAWMIQLKTLLCLFFGLGSVLAWIKGQKSSKWMVLSWTLFLCSVLSKSASLPLPLILFYVSFKKSKFSKLHLLIPFFVISSWGGYKVLFSPVASEAVERAAKISQVKTVEPKQVPTQDPIQVTPPPDIKITRSEDQSQIKVTSTVHEEKPQPQEKDESDLTPPPNLVSQSKHALQFVGLNFDLALQTLNYYFWQTLIPIHTQPVKGLNFHRADFVEYIHLVFLIILVILLWKDSGFFYLIAAHILLLPFLGFIPAPFMNVTWVSDQHLYLVLPLFLALWLRIVAKIKWERSYLIPLFFLLIYGFGTFKAAQIYRNQETFYLKSLEYNPYNIPIAYNLAYNYILDGEIDKAYEILDVTIVITKDKPETRENIFYPYLLKLYITLKAAMTNEN